MKKKCWACKRVLNKTNFYPSSLIYWDYLCINCHREKGRLYRQVNKKKIAEQKREYAKANKEKLSKCIKEWAKNNKDKIKVNSHRWYVKKKRENPEYFSIIRRGNNSKIVARIRKYRREHPEKVAEWKHKRRGLEAKLGGHFIAEEWKELKKKFNNACPKCQRKEPEIKLTVDHKIPPARWKKWRKENKPNYKWNDIENIQPLCKSCNSKKWIKILPKGTADGSGFDVPDG